GLLVADLGEEATHLGDDLVGSVVPMEGLSSFVLSKLGPSDVVGDVATCRQMLLLAIGPVHQHERRSLDRRQEAANGGVEPVPLRMVCAWSAGRARPTPEPLPLPRICGTRVVDREPSSCSPSALRFGDRPLPILSAWFPRGFLVRCERRRELEVDDARNTFRVRGGEERGDEAPPTR